MDNNYCAHVADYYEQQYLKADAVCEATKQPRDKHGRWSSGSGTKHKDVYMRADALRSWLTYQAGADYVDFW